MTKYRKKPVFIEAIQITHTTFDAPHPNPEHVKGLIYDPINREVRISGSGETGHIGDWIVLDALCVPSFYNNRIFQKIYEAVNE